MRRLGGPHARAALPSGSRSVGLGSSAHGLWEERTAAESATSSRCRIHDACRRTRSESGIDPVSSRTPRLDRLLLLGKDTRPSVPVGGSWPTASGLRSTTRPHPFWGGPRHETAARLEEGIRSLLDSLAASLA